MSNKLTLVWWSGVHWSVSHSSSLSTSITPESFVNSPPPTADVSSPADWENSYLCHKKEKSLIILGQISLLPPLQSSSLAPPWMMDCFRPISLQDLRKTHWVPYESLIKSHTYHPDWAVLFLLVNIPHELLNLNMEYHKDQSWDLFCLSRTCYPWDR